MPRPQHLRNFIDVDDDVFDSFSVAAQQALIASATSRLTSSTELSQSKAALSQAQSVIFRSHVESVTQLYNTIRSLSSINRMSFDQISFARTYIRSAEGFMPYLTNAEARRDYTDMIKYMSHACRCVDSTDDMPEYSVEHTDPHTVSFTSRTDGLVRSYVMSSSTMYLRTSLMITEGIILPLCKSIDEVIESTKSTYTPCREYQVILAGRDGSQLYYNTTPGSLSTSLSKIAEEYDGAFCVESITINYTHNSNIDEVITRSCVDAGYGEGIPYCVTVSGRKYWILDLAASDSRCVFYARQIWQLFASRSSAIVDITVTTKRRQILSAWNRDIRSTGIAPVYGVYNIATIQRVYPCNYRVITSLDMLARILPSPLDTTLICHYYYDCGHICAIISDDVLDKNVRQGLMRMSNKTVLSQLRPTKHVACKRSDIIVLDIECYRQSETIESMSVRGQPRDTPKSDKYTHIPLLTCMLVDDQYIVCKGDQCVQQLFNVIASYSWPDKEVTIWIHNGGKYDVYLMFDDILCNATEVGREPVKVLDTNGALVSVQFRMDTGIIVTFKDSFRLLPKSLDTLSSAYNVGSKHPCDIVNVTRDQLLNCKVYEDYIKHDCKLLHSVLSMYRRDMLSRGYSDPLAFTTQSSFTKHLFLEKFYDDSKPIYTIPRWLHKYIEKSYNGGRNEVYQLGVSQGPLHMYDFTSLYPYVGTFDLPYGPPSYGSIGVSPRGVLATTSNVSCMFGFVEVTIVDTPRHILPYYGMHRDSSYVFDYVYNQRVVITTIELSRMVSLGYVIYMHSSAQYKKAPLLKNMFETLFDYRKSTHDLEAKLAIVSAYGMFGFKKYDRSVVKVYHRNAIEHILVRELSGSAVRHEHHSGMIVVNEKVHVHKARCNIAIASFISAYGRDLLYQLMVDIESRGGKVHYCDTDSVITNYAIHDNVDMRNKWMGSNMGSGLGELKLEYSDISQVVIAGLKVYGLKLSDSKCIVKIKGVNGIQQTLEEYNSLAAACNNGDNYISKPVTTLMRRSFDTQHIIEKRTDMRLPLRYLKGIVDSDGSVQPLSGRRK